ncbi:MAG: hypothetical protein JRF27_02220 [Deltaproteobacteria bacterium]|nr:hypothetical protein [Deltaproteobacteria bacterium]
MEITTNIDKEAGLRTHKVTGTLSIDDLMAKLGEIYSIPDFQPDMNVLWDLRSADLASFSTSDIQKVRDFVGYKWGTGGSSRAALVVSRDIDFGLSRMYEISLESITTSLLQVFRDFDEALTWLRS